MLIRLAENADVDAAYQIRCEASAALNALGADQWQGAYPARADFERDILMNRLFVAEVASEIAGVASISPGPDGNYDHIDGAWLSSDRETLYVVIHRIAVRNAFQGRGVAKALFQKAEQMAHALGHASVRIDTHEKNAKMLQLLSRLGYQRCGKIRLQTAEPGADPLRIAFEKVLVQ